MKIPNQDPLMLAPLLYVPADRPNLRDMIEGKCNLGACTLAICLEDAVRSENRRQAAAELRRTLSLIAVTPRPVLLRPADIDSLDWILQHMPLEHIRGFILPKATVETIHLWVNRTLGQYSIIPIMETRLVLDPIGRRDLAHACAEHPKVIPGARIGANDIFSILGGLRRPAGRTIYETPVGAVIDDLLAAFSAREVRLCAPVVDRIGEIETLEREVEDDIARGLFAKTAVHPSQVAAIWRAYRPLPNDLADAYRILNPDAPAVSISGGRMLEPACHREWAANLLKRDALYNFYGASLSSFGGSSGGVP